jgi:hypothetical protein
MKLSNNKGHILSRVARSAEALVDAFWASRARAHDCCGC